MIEKKTANANGKGTIVYKVVVKDVWGEKSVEPVITESTFNVLLPNGYDSNQKKHGEEFLFDGRLDF